MVRRDYRRITRRFLAGIVVGLATVILVLSCWSCAPLTRLVPPALPDGTFVVKHSEYYQRLWKEVEACSGESYPMSRVAFYAVPVNTPRGFTYSGTKNLAGYGDRGRNLILIGTPWLLEDRILRHEMLHVIASPQGHDPLYFGLWDPDSVRVRGKCSHLIVCATCARF